MKLLLHPTTEYQFEALKHTNPHAVLITGEDGTGKKTVAHTLASELLSVELNKHPYFLEIMPEKQSIGIETIRQLRDFLGKRTTGQNDLRRAVIVRDGHLMTTEAQNALLKNLEEPPADTVLIITASDITKLLPTIRSRAQQLHVVPVSLEEAKAYYQSVNEQQLIAAFYMSDGRVGLLNALLNDDEAHPLVAAISNAKELLRMNQYERLAQADALSKQKELLPMLLIGMQRILASGLKQATARDNTAQTRAFYHSSRAVYDAQAALQRNVNAKLLLTDLFLHL